MIASNTYIGFGSNSTGNLLSVNGGTLSNSGSLQMGGSGGNGTLTLNNGGQIYATNIVIYTNSTLGGNGTVNAQPGGVTVNGGTIAPNGSNNLVINGDLNFSTIDSTYLWSLFNNTTNAPGINYTAPLVVTNGSLTVIPGAIFDINLTNLVTQTDPFWTNNQSWTVMTGTNVSAGTNFLATLIGPGTAGFLNSEFTFTATNGTLVLNYTAPVTTIVTNSANTNINVTPGVNNSVTQNGTGTTTLGGSNAAALSIVVNNGTLNATNTTTVLASLVNVTVNGGTFGIQGTGTNTVNSLTVNGGTVSSVSGAIVNVTNAFSMTGGTLSGGTYQSANYIFTPSNTATVSATLANAGGNSSALISNSSTGFAGTTIFNSAMTYTGGTLITNATLQLGSGTATGSLLGVVSNNGVFQNGSSVSLSLTNLATNITGTGIIAQAGTGTLTLAASALNVFTGSFAVSTNGTLQLTNNSDLGGGTNVYLANSGTLQLSGSVTNFSAPVVVTNGVGIVSNGGSGTVTLLGTLTKLDRTLVLSGGNIIVTGSIIGRVGATNFFDSDLIISNATSVTISTNENYFGPTLVEQGSTLVIATNNALPTDTVLTLGTVTDSGNNTFDLASNNQSLAGLASPTGAASFNLVTNSGAGTVTRTLNDTANPTNTTYAGTIAGNIALVRAGTGSTLLTGSNSYSGGTTITSGRLITANNNALGTGNVSLNGGTLQLNSPLTISTLIWTNSTASSSQIALPNAIGTNDYLNVTGAITLGSAISYFDLTGANLSVGSTAELLYFGTNGLTTNQFAVTGISSYSLLIENTNSLWIQVTQNGLIVYPTTTTISNTATYNSATFLSNGILDVTSSGNLTITTNVEVSNNSTVNLNGVMTVSNTLTIDDGSTLTGGGTLNANLSNSGSVTMGGMTINGGVNNSGFISGTGTVNGNLTNGGTLMPGNGTTGTLTVNGNFSQTATGTFILTPNGSTTSNNLNASGGITLGGTLVVSPANGYILQMGNRYNFLLAVGGISGAFASIDMPLGYRGRFLLSSNNTLGSLLIAPQSYTQMAGNQNQLSVARALNSFINATSGDRLVISTSLDSLTAGQYAQAFNAIMPTFYQQMATIAFNNANAQNMELSQRLWGVRLAEGGGFSMNGFADTTPFLEGQGDGESVMDPSKDILRPGADNHWGMFVDMNGIFANASSGNMLPGYNSQSGGVTTGLTYKWNKNFASGIYTGYQGTYTKSGANGSGLGTGSTLLDNAVRFGVFGSYGQADGKGFFVNALAGGAYHNFQATRVIQYTGMNRTANSSPGAGELDTMLATGYDIQKGKFTFGPTASLQYTYLGVNSFKETGAQSIDFNSAGWKSSSMLSSVGAHAAYNWQARPGILVIPQVSLSWQHEFLQNPYAINGNLGGISPNFSDWSTAPLRDFLYTGVGFTVEFAKRWNTSFFYNTAAGNNTLQSQNFFWSLGLKF